MSDSEKYVDEGWKESVSREKGQTSSTPTAAGPTQTVTDKQARDEIPEVNFFNYVASLAFQAVIFLGEVENPATNKREENFPQAKFLIDTLLMLREKTKGNLAKDEEDLLNATIYELQMKYVEKINPPPLR